MSWPPPTSGRGASRAKPASRAPSTWLSLWLWSALWANSSLARRLIVAPQRPTRGRAFLKAREDNTEQATRRAFSEADSSLLFPSRRGLSVGVGQHPASLARLLAFTTFGWSQQEEEQNTRSAPTTCRRLAKARLERATREPTPTRPEQTSVQLQSVGQCWDTLHVASFSFVSFSLARWRKETLGGMKQAQGQMYDVELGNQQRHTLGFKFWRETKRKLA